MWPSPGASLLRHFFIFNWLWGFSRSFLGECHALAIRLFCPLCHRCFLRWQLLLYISGFENLSGLIFVLDKIVLGHRHIWRCWFRFNYHFQPDLLTAVQYSIKRGGVIELRYYSSSASGYVCFYEAEILKSLKACDTRIISPYISIVVELQVLARYVRFWNQRFYAG